MFDIPKESKGSDKEEVLGIPKESKGSIDNIVSQYPALFLSPNKQHDGNVMDCDGHVNTDGDVNCDRHVNNEHDVDVTSRVFPKVDDSGNVARIVLGLKFVFLKI